jgi:uncharacterized membrane protein YbhN (UPF0104 family)
MAILRFIGFCVLAVPVNITALGFVIVTWTTAEVDTRTRLVTSVGALGAVVVSLVMGTRLCVRALHGRRDHG